MNPETLEKAFTSGQHGRNQYGQRALKQDIDLTSPHKNSQYGKNKADGIKQLRDVYML